MEREMCPIIKGQCVDGNGCALWDDNEMQCKIITIDDKLSQIQVNTKENG